MSVVFDVVVRLFQWICHTTGLSYFELNILVYTFLVPASWWAIVSWRLRHWYWPGWIHLGIPALYLLEKERLARFSESFYKANTEALLWLGGGTETGYIQYSILAGILIPGLIYGLLWLAPKRSLKVLYAGLILGNLLWYFWAWFRIEPQ